MSSIRIRTVLVVIPVAALLGVGACKKSGPDKPASDSTTVAAAPASGGHDAATEQNNMNVVRAVMEKAFNNGDTAIITEHTASDFVEHNPSPGSEPGIEGFKKFVIEWRKGYPDTKVTIDDIIASGDKVIVRNTLSGTNTGACMGMAATNKHVNVEGIDILRIENGKVKEHWGQFDAMGMMTQLGMMPEHHDGATGGAAHGDTSAAPSEKK